MKLKEESFSFISQQICSELHKKRHVGFYSLMFFVYKPVKMPITQPVNLHSISVLIYDSGLSDVPHTGSCQSCENVKVHRIMP